MSVEVVVYVTNYCPYCFRAKRLLDSKKVTYQEVDVTNDPEKRDWLRKTTKMSTVPQIFIAGVPVGGSDDLHALDRAGKLDPMLRGETPS